MSEGTIKDLIGVMDRGFAAQKEQGSRFENAMIDLTRELRKNASPSSAAGVTLSHLLIIVGALASIGGFLAVGMATDISAITSRMEADNVRERIDSATQAQMKESLREVGSGLAGTVGWQPIATRADERLLVLEREVNYLRWGNPVKPEAPPP